MNRKQRLSTAAAMLCNNTDFQKWIGAEGKDQAAEFMRLRLSIESRSELNTCERAANEFHNLRRSFISRTGN